MAADGMSGVSEGPSAVEQHSGRRAPKKISVTVQQQGTEWRDQKRRQFQGPFAVLSSPGAHDDGDPTRPEPNFRLEEENQGIPAHLNSFAERSGFRQRWSGREQPHRYLRCALAQV
jgi:hypothetical protein